MSGPTGRADRELGDAGDVGRLARHAQLDLLADLGVDDAIGRERCGDDAGLDAARVRGRDRRRLRRNARARAALAVVALSGRRGADRKDQARQQDQEQAARWQVGTIVAQPTRSDVHCRAPWWTCRSSRPTRYAWPFVVQICVARRASR